jgi:nitric oxide reductase NorQ protein
MTMTDKSLAEAQAALSLSMPRYATIASLSNDMPVLLAAVFAQDSNPVLAGILDTYSNKSSKLRGRAANNRPEATKETAKVPTMPDGEKSYARPNGDLYYTRPWGEHDDVLVLRKARERQHFTMLYGAPGCGKTALVEAAFGTDLFTILGSGDTEVADLVGGYVQTPVGGWAWTDGPLIKAAEAGKPLLIDEVGLIDPKVMSIVYGLMDGRREYTVTSNPDRGTVKAIDGFFVIAATNPNAPGVRLSEALLSRFVLQVEMTTDWALARTLGAPSFIVTAAQNLAKKQASGEVSWAPQFRELLAFRDLETDFGTKFAIENLLAAAPEMDRPVVSDVFSRAYGEAILPARI